MLRLAAVLIALVAFALPAFSQGMPGMPPGPPMGPPGMGPMMMPPVLMAPLVNMLVADGVLYVACNGKLMAFEAKTLKLIAQVDYWTPPQAPMGPGGMPGMPGGPPVPAGPPPAAPN